MRRLIAFGMLITAGLWGTCVQAIVNDDGDTLYRLVRVREPWPGEEDSCRRISREIKAQVDAVDQTTPGFEATQHMIFGVKEILCDDQIRGVYQILLIAIRNRGIKLAGERPDGEVSSNILVGKYAGKIHLQIMQGFKDWLREVPDFEGGTPEDLIPLLDTYLQSRNIHGLAAFLSKQEYSAFKRGEGWKADLKRSWNMTKYGRIAALTCAALIAGAVGERWLMGTPPEVRLQDDLPRVLAPAEPGPRTDPQKAADTAAMQRGVQAAQALAPPH